MFNFNVSLEESTLFYDSTHEAIGMFGTPLKYIKAENKEKDVILGEFKQQNYSSNNVYDIYGKFENVTSFEGENLYSKFGIFAQDSMNIYVSDKTFVDLGFTPKPNDILWWSDAGVALEVTRASKEQEESGFYLGGRKVVAYKLVTHKYIFDNDNFESGITELDDKANNIISADEIKKTNLDDSINDILDSNETSPWEM